MTTFGTKNTETNIHFLRIEFAFKMELILLFYKMYYNIRPGLGLQCVIVVFPDDTHLFFWFLVENNYTCTMAGRYRKCPGDAVFFFFFFVFFSFV